MAQVLVVHASRHGSTTDVAARIAEHLSLDPPNGIVWGPWRDRAGAL
jgi:hypothetical protein